MTVYCCIHSSKFQNVRSTQGTQSLPSTFKQKKTADNSWTYTTKNSSLLPKTDLNDFHFTPNIRLHVNNLIQEGYINVPNFFLMPTYAEGCCKSTNLQYHCFFFLSFNFWIFWFFKVQKPDQVVQAKNATYNNMQLAFCTGGLFNMAGSLGKEFHRLLVTLHGCILTIMKALKKVQTGFQHKSQHSASRVAARCEEDVVRMLHT
jgi:hypothetical protein